MEGTAFNSVSRSYWKPAGCVSVLVCILIISKIWPYLRAPVKMEVFPPSEDTYVLPFGDTRGDLLRRQYSMVERFLTHRTEEVRTAE